MVSLRALLLAFLFVVAVPHVAADPTEPATCVAGSTDPLVDRAASCTTGCDAGNVFPVVDWSVDCATGCDVSGGNAFPIVDRALACAAHVGSNPPPV